MQLYVVRHGEAKREAEDPQRSLSEEGRSAVERVADFLASFQLSLDQIEHSGKLRARQTAEILAARLSPGKGIIETFGMAPNDDVGAMYSRLQGESKNLMLVGHLPYVSRLVTRLVELRTDRDVVHFQTGGMVRLDRLQGQWVLRWIIVPEMLPPRN